MRRNLPRSLSKTHNPGSMLQAGKLITQINDPLLKIRPEYLYHAVKSPKPDIEAMIRQLRLVKTIDENRYRALKKQLPYVTCGIFNPPVRKTENFGWISHFIIDIDHLSQKQMDLVALKNNLAKDPRVKLLFISPGEDGLKVLFQLLDKCFDAGHYSLFYKQFLKQFSAQYHLEQVADQVTSDVTRACFVSYDPDVYYNPDAEPVRLEAFIDRDNPFEMSELRFAQKREEKKNDGEEEIVKSKDPEPDILAAIKAKLHPGSRTVREKQIYVPEEMEKIVASVIVQMQQFDIETSEVTDIHYGKKFRFQVQNRKAEINLFYGRKGFSIVQSPRCGTHPEFNEICAKILGEFLFNG